jgi:hypothetical protein
VHRWLHAKPRNVTTRQVLAPYRPGEDTMVVVVVVVE